MNINTNQPPEPLVEPGRRYFHLDSEFRQEWHKLLELDPHAPLDLLDTNGSLFALGESTTITLLRPWLSHFTSRLRLATFEEHYLLNQAPGFMQMRGQLNEKIQWRLIPAQLRGQIQQAFAVSGDHLIKKPVREAHHGFTEINSGNAKGHIEYFEQVWQMSDSAPPAIILGL